MGNKTTYKALYCNKSNDDPSAMNIIARRPEAEIDESAYPVSPIGNFGTIM